MASLEHPRNLKENAQNRVINEVIGVAGTHSRRTSTGGKYACLVYSIVLAYSLT